MSIDLLWNNSLKNLKYFQEFLFENYLIKDFKKIKDFKLKCKGSLRSNLLLNFLHIFYTNMKIKNRIKPKIKKGTINFLKFIIILIIIIIIILL